MQPFSEVNAGTPSIESASFWKQPERVPVTGDPDTDTARTVGIMNGHVHNGAADAGRNHFADRSPVVQLMAEQAVRQFAGISGGTDAAGIAGCAWWWCKTYLKFVHHELTLRRRLGEAGHLQGLISPEVLVRMSKPEGDCAIFSMCIAAFLEVYGIPYELVTVKVSAKEPREYGHVYVYAVLPDGARMPLDASHGDYPGWQVPSRDIKWEENQHGSAALQVWNSSGNPVTDRGSRFDGLHNYGRRRGLGDVCDMGASDYDLGLCASMGYTTYGTPGVSTTYLDFPAPSSDQYVTPTGAPVPAGTPISIAPSQNSAQWAAFATALAKMGFQQAAITSIQPGTVVGPNGQILRQATGLPVPVGGGVTAALGGSSSLLMIGGLVLAGLFAMSMMKGGR